MHLRNIIGDQSPARCNPIHHSPLSSVLQAVLPSAHCELIHPTTGQLLQKDTVKDSIKRLTMDTWTCEHSFDAADPSQFQCPQMKNHCSHTCLHPFLLPLTAQSIFPSAAFMTPLPQMPEEYNFSEEMFSLEIYF